LSRKRRRNVLFLGGKKTSGGESLFNFLHREETGKVQPTRKLELANDMGAGKGKCRNCGATRSLGGEKELYLCGWKGVKERAVRNGVKISLGEKHRERSNYGARSIRLGGG